MLTCEPPNQKKNYIYSCHLLAQVQVKVGCLEGERHKPSYKELLDNPVLYYSGALQHYDLYVTMQIFANNQPLCMPIRTSYKFIEKQPWVWDEWLTLPLRIKDLPRNSQLAITLYDIESPQKDDVPVCGSTISLFDKYGEFRQGSYELRMWPNKIADGSTKSTTPGFFADYKENEFDDFSNFSGINKNNYSDNQNQSTQIVKNPNFSAINQSLTINNNSNIGDEFPMLDELDRLAKMSKFHSNGQIIKQDWLDKQTLKEIQKTIKLEKESSKFFYLSIELAQIKCEDTKFIVLYYEEDADRVIQTIPTNELFVINDLELDTDNIIELKHRQLEHSKHMGILDMNLKPDTDIKNMLTKIVNYPVNRALKREELTLLWKYCYYLTQNKKALTKVLQCFDLNLEFEKNIYSELILKWQPMDVEDALELLGSKYKDHPKIRSYAISRLSLASNEELILYLLQLVQALRYENFSKKSNLLLTKNETNNNKQLLNNSSKLEINKNSLKLSNDKIKKENNEQSKLEFSSTEIESNFNKTDQLEQSNKNIFDLNLKSFLLTRAKQNESVALCLYWFIKVEIKDTNIALNHVVPSPLPYLPKADSLINIISNASVSNPNDNDNDNNKILNDLNKKNNEDKFENNNSNVQDNSNTYSKNVNQQSNLINYTKTNFQIFMDELLENLRNGNSYARSIYEKILNQEKFLKSLNDIVKAVSRESGATDKKVVKLRALLNESCKNSSNYFNLLKLEPEIPLILDPNVYVKGIIVEKTSMFKSNLMPCKFVFKTDDDEYSAIYKIGDDLRQDQLVVQMIALMDKLLKQENLDLKLTPYKVVATGLKEGFVQFIDSIAVSSILKGEYRTIKEYLRKYNPSETDKYGIDSEAMDSYVRSCAGYIVITYILGIGDRHYDNILITKEGRMFHVDFGYILGRDPKPFQPIIKWTKDMADGMGGIKENKEYEDFKKYCMNSYLIFRRHANLILNLFSLMVDANIPDIALEPDKTVKKIMDRFKLDVTDEQAQILLLKEIESNYDTIVGNITDIIHTYSTAQK